MLPLGSHLASTVFTTAEPTIPPCAYNQLTSLFQVAGAEKTRQRPPLINFTNISLKKMNERGKIRSMKHVKFVISQVKLRTSCGIFPPFIF